MDLQTSTDISSWSRSSTKESADAEDALEQNSAFLDWNISKLGKSCCVGGLQYSCNLKIQKHIVLRSAKETWLQSRCYALQETSTANMPVTRQVLAHAQTRSLIPNRRSKSTNQSTLYK